MDFISQRQSIAQSFASQTEQQSSYLLSSRASRRKIIYEPSYNEEAEMDDFKQEIEQKYLFSIANKTYTFPLLPQAFKLVSLLDNEDYSDIENCEQYNLYQQNQIHEHNFKKVNQKMTEKTAANKVFKSQCSAINSLLTTLKSQKQKLQSLTQQLSKKYSNKSDFDKKNYHQVVQNMLFLDTVKNDKNNEKTQQLFIRKQRLKTEPYEKSIGLITKKK